MKINKVINCFRKQIQIWDGVFVCAFKEKEKDVAAMFVIPDMYHRLNNLVNIFFSKDMYLNIVYLNVKYILYYELNI